MIKYVQSELLKNRKSFAVKMLFLLPAVCVLTAFLLMGGTYVQVLAYNWWYILFLPFLLAYVCACLICHDKKKNFHGLLGIVENKADLALGKSLAATLYLAAANGIFFVLIGFVGCILDRQIGILANLLASIVLTVTYAWQIPFFMLLAMETNLFVPVLVSILCNFGVACLCATESVWWIPFAVPARMMCHIVGILPNGLLTEDNSLPGGTGIVLSGVLLTAALYGIMTLVFRKTFSKQEV